MIILLNILNITTNSNCYAYLNDHIDNAQNNSEGMDTVFPISIFKFIRSPERTPVKKPDKVSQQGDNQQPSNSSLLILSK